MEILLRKHAIQIIVIIMAAMGLFGQCRAGDFDKQEYSSNLGVDLIAVKQGYVPDSDGGPESWVSLQITNRHSNATAFIHDIGGIIEPSQDCAYSTTSFPIDPNHTTFPIALEPGMIAGVNQLELVMGLPSWVRFPNDANVPTDKQHWPVLSHVCLKTADRAPLKYPITGPVVPLAGPPETLRQSRR